MCGSGLRCYGCFDGFTCTDFSSFFINGLYFFLIALPFISCIMRYRWPEGNTSVRCVQPAADADGDAVARPGRGAAAAAAADRHGLCL
jgi:hypothetical protein